MQFAIEKDSYIHLFSNGLVSAIAAVIDGSTAYVTVTEVLHTASPTAHRHNAETALDNSIVANWRTGDAPKFQVRNVEPVFRAMCEECHNRWCLDDAGSCVLAAANKARAEATA